MTETLYKNALNDKFFTRDKIDIPRVRTEPLNCKHKSQGVLFIVPENYISIKKDTFTFTHHIILLDYHFNP